MPTDRGIEALDPLALRTSAAAADGAFVRFDSTFHPANVASDEDARLTHRRWSIDVPTEHVHPKQAEYWRVLDGEFRVEIDGIEHALADGDEIVIPPGAAHRVWNPLDRPIRVRFEFRPALQSEALTETLYALGQAGVLDDAGNLGIAQFSVLVDEYPDHLYLTAAPIPVQDALATVLAPIARLLGYSPAHALEDAERES